MDGFKTFLRAEGKTDDTIKTYSRSVEGYFKWYRESYGPEPEKLLAVNVSDYVAYLRAVKNIRGTSLNPKVAALKCYNRYLIESGVQAEIVVIDKHRDKIQSSGVSPTDIGQKEVDAFRQAVLMGSGIRDHAMDNILHNYPDVLTFKQMTEILQIGKHSGLKLLQEDKIKHARVGKKYVISKLSLINFLDGTSK